MTSKHEPSFGHSLRRLRQASGLSQEELAERAGLTAAAIGALERGERRHPYPHTLQVLANALGLSAVDRTSFFTSVPRRGSGQHRGTGAGTSTSASRWSRPPVPLSPLLGREQDVATITGLFQHGHARIVTLTGPGGIGKTRLAVEVAGMLQEQFEDGTVWIDLAPITDPDLVPSTIARSLGLSDRARENFIESLERYLANRQVLLILDSFEQVLPAATSVSTLLERCAQLAVLATSRAALHVHGECEFPVPPLELPEPGTLRSTTKIVRSPAVDLFLQRTRAVRPQFEVTDLNAEDVAAICIQVDGIPLALELAAAQLKYMSPATLRAGLSHRLTLLEGGPRDIPDRQRSLRATMERSYELLTAVEQRLFRGLSIFGGGFTRTAVSNVCRMGECTHEEVVHALLALVDQSMVQVDFDSHGEDRFTMLETIREYARELLVKRGEEGLLADRHAHYFCDVAEAAERHLAEPMRQVWLQRLEGEIDNLRAAFSWTTTRGDPCVGLRLLGALSVSGHRQVDVLFPGEPGWFWIPHGTTHEGSRWAELLLARPITSCTADARASALYAAAALAWKREDYSAARRYADESVALRRAVGDRRRLAFSLAIAGNIATSQGDLERAQQLHGESLTVFQELDDQWGIAYARTNRGDVFLRSGRPSVADRDYTESLAYFADVEDDWAQGIVLHTLATIAWVCRDIETARARFNASVAIFRAMGQRESLARALIGLAAATLRGGETEEARRLLEESMHIWRDVGSVAGMALCLTGMAGVQAVRGQFNESAQLFGLAETHRQPPSLHVIDAEFFSDYRDETRQQLGDEEFARIWATGQVIPLHHAVHDVLIADRAARACNLWLVGETEKAIETIELVLTVAVSEGLVRSLVEAGPEVFALLAAARKTSNYPSYIDRLLAKYLAGDTAGVPSKPPAQPGHEQLVEPLSERELEVLRLIAAGRTNADIADDLYLAVGTVKRHTHNIYSKLGVRTRAQAVARATALGHLAESCPGRSRVTGSAG